MAILSCLPGLKVNVRIGSELAKEYDAPAEEVEARSKSFEFYKIPSRVGDGMPYSLSYIESKPGEHFEFVIDTRDTKLHQAGNSQKIRLTAVLDGFKACPDIVRSELFTYSNCLTGSHDTGFFSTSFKFAALDIVEVPVPEKDIKKQIEEANKYGTLLIKLELVRIKESLSTAGHNISTPKPAVMGVAEKALKGKAVDSRTTFQSEPTHVPNFAAIDYSDSKRRPFAIFEFRYRTMEGLIRESIVPRPEEVIDVEEEYMRIKRIKPEIAAEPRGIKREPMEPALFAARYKQRRLEDGKVEIDLTDD
ncbi:hypothetical protein QBC32DRAFT_68765 [Pseudoneurospora amorphoporcata]|uniref:DUF7918 domain-containing protein n=1 Tax=Pseudoneurospora amorphoporcata TaxID=241081 RepID=A0AAN6NZP2_9PEZI|nr:hypothetical protein QBC32DRAFT_68765 [Pseudoneurospora amorphoporcata]